MLRGTFAAWLCLASELYRRFRGHWNAEVELLPPSESSGSDFNTRLCEQSDMELKAFPNVRPESPFNTTVHIGNYDGPRLEIIAHERPIGPRRNPERMMVQFDPQLGPCAVPHEH
mmetsp:Transcript_125631/g.250686  ORF Transcript_125631/g.250686 Transcript_125631/m.250686 type:complete len:115 (-) Transcript_125631:1105-1449(-)